MAHDFGELCKNTAWRTRAQVEDHCRTVYGVELRVLTPREAAGLVLGFPSERADLLLFDAEVDTGEDVGLCRGCVFIVHKRLDEVAPPMVPAPWFSVEVDHFIDEDGRPAQCDMAKYEHQEELEQLARQAANCAG